MINAYDQSYLSKISHSVGYMLHYAVHEYNLKGDEFIGLFIQSKISERIEEGDVNYLAGKSGLDLFLDVMDIISDKKYLPKNIKVYTRTKEYWVGWVITHYQWYSGKSFKHIIDNIPYDNLIKLYDPLHEADIYKSYEVFDNYLKKGISNLKRIRLLCKLSQTELSKLSNVSVNTIRAYENKSKDINKSQINILRQLSNALKCNALDLID